MTEIDAYSQAAKELAGSQRHEGLWLKCYSEAGGDEAQAKISYARLRVAMLISSDYSPTQTEGTENGIRDDGRSTGAESQLESPSVVEKPAELGEDFTVGV